MSDPRSWEIDTERTTASFRTPTQTEGYEIVCDPKSEFGVIVHRENTTGERFFEGHVSKGSTMSRSRAREGDLITISWDKNEGRFAGGTIEFI